jgi:hypothetical protein
MRTVGAVPPSDVRIFPRDALDDAAVLKRVDADSSGEFGGAANGRTNGRLRAEELDGHNG